MNILGFIFDLDGTLVNSKLDFDAMRQEMGLGPDESILESIEQMDKVEAHRCRSILQQHELRGANNATPMPGVHEFLDYLDNMNIQRAIVTRNARNMAMQMLHKCQLKFDTLIAREDGPTKPNPWAINHICESWGVQPHRVVMVGDFRFDIEAGRRAGTKTVFFTQGSNVEDPDLTSNADWSLKSFDQPENLLAALGLLRPA